MAKHEVSVTHGHECAVDTNVGTPRTLRPSVVGPPAPRRGLPDPNRRRKAPDVLAKVDRRLDPF